METRPSPVVDYGDSGRAQLGAAAKNALVGMLRAVEQLRDGAGLHDPAVQHDRPTTPVRTRQPITVTDPRARRGRHCHQDGPAAPGPYLLHACSAAVVADFSSAFIANHPGKNLAERPQLEWLSDKTQLVTLPTGGNDAHFADVDGLLRQRGDHHNLQGQVGERSLC